VKIIGLLTLAAVLYTTAFAQKKPEDTEARNKRAVSVAPARHSNSLETPRSHYDPITVPKSGSSSSRELAKIEQSSVHQVKNSPKTNTASRTRVQPVAGTQSRTKSKPMKFSYHAPTAANKTSAKNPSSPLLRAR
jgi:hypothetical protein